MAGSKAGALHRLVMGLEPSRGMATIIYLIPTVGLWMALGSDFFARRGFGDFRWFVWAVWGLSVLAVIVNARRWYAYRVVLRMSKDPDLAALIPPVETEPTERSESAQPGPRVGWWVRVPRGGTRSRPRRVERSANVLGRPPLNIVYLRVFDNRTRSRNFARGAWREFGYVHLLRSATAVKPSELNGLRRHDGIFVTSREELADRLDRAEVEPFRPGWRSIASIAGSTVLTYDRYGSYPLRDPLCRGDFWKSALDMLLARADLVVLDLSGYRRTFAGTQFELQRIVDTVPIRKVLLVADPHSRQRFLNEQVTAAWGQMADGSPNTGGPLEIQAAVTDHFRQVQLSQYDPGIVKWELRPSRAQTRRLLEHMQRMVEDPRVQVIRSVPGPPWGLITALAAAAIGVGVAVPAIGSALGGEPAVMLDQTAMQFVAPGTGSSSEPRTLRLTNVGPRSVHVDGHLVGGPHAAEFQVLGSTCVGEIVAGRSCDVSVAFTPAASGPRSASLLLNVREADNDPWATLIGTSPPGQGQGHDPGPGPGAIVVNPKALAFGEQPVATPSKSLTVKVSASGTQAVAIDKIGVMGADPPDFAVTTDTCSEKILKPGTGCRIGIRFVPGALGGRTAVVRIPRTDGGTPAEVPLAGDGVASPCSTVAPFVVGDPLETALGKIKKACLAVGPVVQQPSDTVPMDSVISSDPGAGEPVGASGSVELTVSSGKVHLPVPNVLGLPLADAEKVLVQHGFTFGGASVVSSPTAKGLVLGSDPEAGAEAGSGSPVRLTVSGGPP